MTLSPRLLAVVDALPLRPGLRVLEVGSGPGAAAREVARRVAPGGHVLAIDRSARATQQLLESSRDVLDAGLLSARTATCADLELLVGEAPYDLAFAVRVGALDGRHPDQFERSVRGIAAMLVPGGRLFIDGGDPLREIPLAGGGGRATYA